METLIEFLATTGCMEDDASDDKKITLMEFLFGPDNRPVIEIDSELTLTEANVHVNLAFIDETPVEERETLVDYLIKYMENYDEPTKSLTPCLSEKSKSDVTISKLETFSDISKTKSDSTLTHTQDTVIEREISDKSQTSRRISETVIDLSNIKDDLEEIFEQAIVKVCELKQIEINDTMSDQEDMENFNAYTKPPTVYYQMPYSVELSDIIEEDESLEQSTRLDDRVIQIRNCAEDLLEYIEDKIQVEVESSSEDEFDVSSLKRSSISLIDLRNIPDLPPSMIIKPKVARVDKSTSTTEISDSISDLSRRNSCCMTEDTSLSSTEKQERVLDKLESLHKFFSKSRLEIIDESQEEEKLSKKELDRHSDIKIGQASLDDVEDIQDECCFNRNDSFCDKFDTTGSLNDKFDACSDQKYNNREKCNVLTEDAIDDQKVTDVKPDTSCQIDSKRGRCHSDNTDMRKKSHSKSKEKKKSKKHDKKTKPCQNEDVKSPSQNVVDNIPPQDIIYVHTDLTESINKHEASDRDVKPSCQVDRSVASDVTTVRTDDAINENDFTEIDRIIADAIKIIIANELESYNYKYP